jgi:hypothetical protein
MFHQRNGKAPAEQIEGTMAPNAAQLASPDYVRPDDRFLYRSDFAGGANGGRWTDAAPGLTGVADRRARRAGDRHAD